MKTKKLQHQENNSMQSPSRSQNDSNLNGSTQSLKSSPAKNASASATPVKKVSFPEASASNGVKKAAVTKRGSRNQNFRNSRVRLSARGRL